VPAFADFKLSDASSAAAAEKVEKVEAAPAAVAAESVVVEAAAPSAPVSQPETSLASRIFASPLAKTLAAARGYSLDQIAGSGPNGRVVKSDVLAFSPPSAVAAAAQPIAAAQPVAAAPLALPLPIPANGAGFKDVPITSIRKVIAQRLSQSKSTIPHYYVSMDVRMDSVMKMRAVLNDGADGEFKLSLNDFIVKACGLGLKDVPEVNSSWGDGIIRMYEDADIAIAVSTGIYIR
jgi:pyruvate dehydrogenase E2 component (dihydrolipoamide acetyltransferase)